MKILLSIIEPDHIFYGILKIKVLLLIVAKTKGAENPIYLNMLIKGNILTKED